jgi:putative peptide zinc metalloprotease protein
MPTFTSDTIVIVEPFTRQPEGEDVIIGVAERGVFLAVPPVAVELLEYFAAGKSVGEVSDLYQQKYGETLDVQDFLDLLQSKGIVSLEGDKTLIKAGSGVPESRQNAKPIRYHFQNFPQSLAQRIFSRPVFACCFVVLALAVAAMVHDPSLIARSSDLFFSRNRALSWIIFTLIAYASIMVHEMGHLVAARAVGVSSRMGISNRLWYLVAETDLTGLWGVPKGQRYLPLLAGLLIDTVSSSLLILLLFARGQNWLSFSMFTVRVVRALILSYWLRVAWQFFLFVRTDIYFVIVNFFNCRNLLKDTENYLRNLAARLIPRLKPVDQSGIPAAERKVIRAYAVVWVLGRVMAFSILFTVTVPVAYSYVRDLGSAFRTGYSANPYNFVDSFVLSVSFLIPVIMGFVLWIDSIIRRERISDGSY